MEAWERMDLQTPAPTFFARPAWAKAIANSHPNLVPWPLCCRLKDQNYAVIPLMRERGGRFGWKIFHGMPFGSYTVVLNTNAGLVEPSAAETILQELLTQGDAVQLNPWPLRPVRVKRADIRTTQETSVIDISGGVENALSRLGGKSKRMAGQARRRGVSCAIEPSIDALDVYWEMLEEAARNRWHLGAPNISRQLIGAVCAEGKDAVEMWIARFEGKPIGGGLALYGSQEVMLWTTAMRAGMETLRPHNILHVDIIQQAAERGIHWYNLGSSANLAGVLKFKQNLGAISSQYETIAHESAPFRAYSALRRMLKRP